MDLITLEFKVVNNVQYFYTFKNFCKLAENPKSGNRMFSVKIIYVVIGWQSEFAAWNQQTFWIGSNRISNTLSFSSNLLTE